MKQIYVISCLMAFLLSCTFAFAQDPAASEKSVRINLYGAYAFEDSFDSYSTGGSYFSGEKQDCFQYGGGLELDLANKVGIELLYLREATTAPTVYYNYSAFAKSADFNVSMNYIMLGLLRKYRKEGSPVELLGGVMLGTNLLYVDCADPEYSNNDVKFAWGLKGGATIWASNAIGIKLHAQLLSTAQAMGGGITIGTGGAGAGIGAYSSIYTFSLGGGLVFNLSSK